MKSAWRKVFFGRAPGRTTHIWERLPVRPTVEQAILADLAEGACWAKRMIPGGQDRGLDQAMRAAYIAGWIESTEQQVAEPAKSNLMLLRLALEGRQEGGIE